MWERLKGLKTYIFNGFIGIVITVAEVANGLGIDWHEVVPYQYVGYVGIALILVNLVLRSVTSTPAKGVTIKPKRKRST